MSVTCDRCNEKMVDRPHAQLRLGDFVVSVTAWGKHFRDEPDLCPVCLIEIAKNGNVCQRETFLESFASLPSKKEGE